MKIEYPVIDMEKTGQNIKQIMQIKGFTVKDVQKFLGLETPQSIYHWFDGRNLPTIDHLYALSELFCLPVDSMLAGNRKFQYESRNYRNERIIIYYNKLLGYKVS